MSQPMRKVTVNAAVDKAGKTMKRRRETENSTDNVDINDSKIGDTVFPSDMLATGPTSFAGLIPTDNLDAQGIRPARRIKTFQDVSGAAAAAAAAAGLGVMLPLSQSDWLPPIMAPRPYKSGGGAIDGVQLGQQTLATTSATATTQVSGLELEECPMDWSLKTSLRFTSAQPFTVLETARTAPRSEVIDAERYFTSCVVDTDTAPHQRLLAAAMTWQFPQNPQAPASSRPIGTSLPSHIQQRRKDWQESLCSLYDSLRTGHCTAFYLVSPQLPTGIGKQPFTVLFTAGGVKGSQRLQAVMGTSSTGVRSMLKMQGVEFETPLVLGSNATSNNTATGRSTSSSIDHTTRSMLVFNGALQVHALFDFLLNRAFTLLDNVCDVPILLAPVQFTHAAIKKFNLTATSSSAPAVAVGGAGKGAARKGQVNTLHTLDVKGGVIPGWVSDRLLDVLTSEDSLHTGNSAPAPATAISMVSVPLPASVALNWHVPTSSTKGNKKQVVPTVHRCVGGCISDTEAKRWSSTLEGLDTAAIKEIKFTSASTTTTSGEEGEGEGKVKGKGKKVKAGGRMYHIVSATNRNLPITL